jgi:serine O-acetyltransferase
MPCRSGRDPEKPSGAVTMPGAFRTDLQKFFLLEFGSRVPGLRQKLGFFLTHFAFHCVAVYRLSRFANRLWRRSRLLGLPFLLVSEILIFFVRMVYHVDFFAADIGPGLYVAHVGPIYIGACRIGPNFSVTHNVTVGVNTLDPDAGTPTLGSNVWIGSSSVLFGNVSVGDGVTINAGSILSKSVPGKCLVGGNPARVLQQDYDNSVLFRGFMSQDFKTERIAAKAETPAT